MVKDLNATNGIIRILEKIWRIFNLHTDTVCLIVGIKILQK